jgi:serine/threonine protein kinase
LNHNNVVKFYETFESNHHILIIMEYISCGDLLTFVRKRTKLSEKIAKFIFRQIIEALQYIHSKNIIHRDIKLDNILIDLNNTIKLCDFGVSKQIKNKEAVFDQCGTPAYIAPEILRNEGFQGFSADIWSAGIVLYAMVQGRVPFFTKEVQDLYLLITKSEYTPLQGSSPELEDLISKILEKNPSKRITSEQILEHPWMNKSEITQKTKGNFYY